MSQGKRKTELSQLNLIFCMMVLWSHCSGHPITVLDHSSWQYGLMICLQRLTFVSVSGFFFLSGLKLTLSKKTPPPYGRYVLSRVKSIFLPYLLAVLIYYVYFIRHGYFSFSLPDLLGYIVRGDLSSPFYFVIALAQFVLLTPVFRWLARRWSPVLLLPLGFGITLLSGQYFNDVLQALSPALSFGYSDRLFTTFLIYYLAGCCAGQYYEKFLDLLRDNRPLILVCGAVFAAADVFFSWGHFVLGKPTLFLELLHMLYQISAIPAIYVLVLDHPRALSPVEQRMDRASFLVYLYHSLVILVFNDWAWRLGIGKVSVQFVLRVLVVYTFTFAACMLWQQALGMLKRKLPATSK